MARKPNYDFEKRRKEAERKAKKDAKLAAKKERKALGIEEPEEIIDLSDYGIERPDGDAPAGDADDDDDAGGTA
jgi:hypothetical protein